jgi:hypothetical protein
VGQTTAHDTAQHVIVTAIRNQLLWPNRGQCFAAGCLRDKLSKNDTTQDPFLIAWLVVRFQCRGVTRYGLGAGRRDISLTNFRQSEPDRAEIKTAQ